MNDGDWEYGRGIARRRAILLDHLGAKVWWLQLCASPRPAGIAVDDDRTPVHITRVMRVR